MKLICYLKPIYFNSRPFQTALRAYLKFTSLPLFYPRLNPSIESGQARREGHEDGSSNVYGRKAITFKHPTTDQFVAIEADTKKYFTGHILGENQVKRFKATKQIGFGNYDK